MKKILLTVPTLLLFCNLSYGHGAMLHPIARQYYCYKQGENPTSKLCRDFYNQGGTYNWNAIRTNVRDTNNYESEIPNGTICSLGTYRALEEMPGDISAPTPLVAGQLEQFKYHATVAHKTDRIDFYITKNGYDRSKPISWDSLDKFCTIPGSSLSTGKNIVWNFSCKIPANRRGLHEIVSVWVTATGTGEIFNGCSDVDILQG